MAETLEAGAIAGIVVGVLAFVVIVVIVVLVVFRKFCQGRGLRRRGRRTPLWKCYSNGQSQVRRIEEEKVKEQRLTRCYPSLPAGAPTGDSVGGINQPVGNGDIFILPDPPPPDNPGP
ncbi:uncharacterized protein LOC143277394 isoform X2 [Babylonia areolata]